MVFWKHVLISVAAAVVYATFWYARNRFEKGEEFKPYKFAATLLVGAGVGVGMAVSGQSVTEGAVEMQLLISVGVISLLEAVLKTGWNKVQMARDR